jgi:YVTN family beta-propeller protein
VSSDGTHVWVANAEGTVSEIEASSGTVIRTIHVGSDPSGVSSDGTHVWVANAGEGTVSEIPTSYTAAKLPLPKLAVTGNLTPVSGSVLVKLPGSSTFVSLAAVGQIPFGTVIDATHGRVRVTTAGPHGATQTITLSEGEFVLTQGRNGMVVATLAGGDFSVCPTASERAHAARSASKHAAGKHVVRKLWAEGHGNFTTDGNYASASVRGTRWLTEDLCEGTLIHVATDRVAVVNRVNHSHVIVKAGHSYLAKVP